MKISSGRFIIYVESWGEGGGEGAGQYGDCSVFFFIIAIFGHPPAPLIQPGDCETKTRHSNLKI